MLAQEKGICNRLSLRWTSFINKITPIFFSLFTVGALIYVFCIIYDPLGLHIKLRYSCISDASMCVCLYLRTTAYSLRARQVSLFLSWQLNYLRVNQKYTLYTYWFVYNIVCFNYLFHLLSFLLSFELLGDMIIHFISGFGTIEYDLTQCLVKK